MLFEAGGEVNDIVERLRGIDSYGVWDEAADELARLRAENEALRADAERHRALSKVIEAFGGNMADVIASLEEAESLRADAERYRWLLQHALYEVGSHGDLMIDYSCDFEHWNDVSASIDAARKEEPK